MGSPRNGHGARGSSCLLAIDVGTSGCRAALVEVLGVPPVATAARSWEIREDPRYPGSLHIDLDRTWEAIAATVRECMEAAGSPGGSIAAVAAGSFRGGIVLLDERREGVWACGAVDARGAPQARAIMAADPGYEDRAYRRSGQTLAMGALPRLLWVREHAPELFERVTAVQMVADWVLTKLTGSLTSTPSNACTTGLFSLADRAWAPEDAAAWHLSPELFPPIVEAGTIVGTVSPAAARATGLAPGTPAVAAGGDASLAAIGLGAVAPGQAAIVGGTFWQQLVNLAQPTTDPDRRVRVNCHAVPDVWQADALVFEAGLTHRWFVEAFGCDANGPGGPAGAEAFAQLDALANDVPPGSKGALAIFSNAMDYGRWEHAAPSFLGLPYRDPDAVAVLYRSLLEATAVVARLNLELIGTAFGARPEAVLFGGGAARSRTWTQVLADVLGRPVVVPAVAGATTLGTATCAAVGAGLHQDVVAARASVDVPVRTFEPDPAVAAAYEDLVGRWSDAYRHQLELTRRGVVEPMWRAPGGRPAAGS